MGAISPAYPQLCTRILWVSDHLPGQIVRQRRQTVAGPRPGAGIVAGIELAARRWPGVVDRARDAAADFTGKRRTARRRGIRATHAQQLSRHRHRQRRRYPTLPGKSATGQFGRMEIDPKGGTAGTAGGTGINHANPPHSDRAPGRNRGTCARRATPAHQQRKIPTPLRARSHAPGQKRTLRHRSASCCGIR